MIRATNSQLQIGLSSFVLNCVHHNRRDRFIGFINSTRGLKKWLDQLDHFQRNLDYTRAVSIESFKTTNDLISNFKLPHKSDVLIFSTLKDMQAVVMNLADALEETYKIGNGSILCSLSDQPLCWFYLGEEDHAQYLFLPRSHEGYDRTMGER